LDGFSVKRQIKLFSNIFKVQIKKFYFIFIFLKLLYLETAKNASPFAHPGSPRPPCLFFFCILLWHI